MSAPRLVVVHRRTRLAELLEVHSMLGAVEFFLSGRGQRLRALNEIFTGDRGPQSTRYDLRVGGRVETQSSSGVVVGTGTGAGGWLASLWGQNRPGFGLPEVTSGELVYFVREAWPSRTTGTSLTAGLLAQGEGLELSARSTLVVFGDGIERDFLRLEWGQGLTVRKAGGELKLMLLK